jgi:hypothetical protein
VRKFLFGDVWIEEGPRFEHLLAEGVPSTPGRNLIGANLVRSSPASLSLRQVGVTLRGNIEGGSGSVLAIGLANRASIGALRQYS